MIKKKTLYLKVKLF